MKVDSSEVIMINRDGKEVENLLLERDRIKGLLKTLLLVKRLLIKKRDVVYQNFFIGLREV